MKTAAPQPAKLPDVKTMLYATIIGAVLTGAGLCLMMWNSANPSSDEFTFSGLFIVPVLWTVGPPLFLFCGILAVKRAIETSVIKKNRSRN